MSPRYDFECIGCHETREVEASIHEEIPDQICQDGYKMIRIYSPFGLQFNSSGFYSTDNKGR